MPEVGEYETAIETADYFVNRASSAIPETFALYRE